MWMKTNMRQGVMVDTETRKGQYKAYAWNNVN